MAWKHCSRPRPMNLEKNVLDHFKDALKFEHSVKTIIRTLNARVKISRRMSALKTIPVLGIKIRCHLISRRSFTKAELDIKHHEVFRKPNSMSHLFYYYFF